MPTNHESEARFREEMSASEKVFSGRLLQVFRDRVILPTGRETTREYIRHPGAAVVIPYLGNRHLMLVRQYRYPVARALLELPAGKIDAGEDPQETITRELEEETGYAARSIRYLNRFHPCVGYSNELLYLYWASDLVKGSLTPDADEIIENVPVPVEEALDMVFSGVISDAKSIIGILWADRILRDVEFRQRFEIRLAE